MLKSDADQIPMLTEAMLRRLDRPGPCYTSYPTADRFVEAFGPAEYAQARLQRASGATVGGRPPLSLYRHIPRTASPARLQHLATLGFKRLSFGVEDFDADVQLQAVQRIQPFEQVRGLIAAARRIGFESINADLIYGLPKQTPGSFARTVAQVAEMRPDRIALYAYAHLPQRFKPQRRIAIAQLPPPDHRVAMLGGAGRWPASAAMATPASAWTTSRCRAMPWRWPSARAGCSATSRATAPSPTAT